MAEQNIQTQDFNGFIAWVRSSYGSAFADSFTPNTYKSSPTYRVYVGTVLTPGMMPWPSTATKSTTKTPTAKVPAARTMPTTGGSPTDWLLQQVMQGNQSGISNWEEESTQSMYGKVPSGGGGLGQGGSTQSAYYSTIQDIPRQYLEDPLRWQIKMEPGMGYYILPSDEWTLDAQRRQQAANAQQITPWQQLQHQQAQQGAASDFWAAKADREQRQRETEQRTTAATQQQQMQIEAQKQEQLALLASQPQSWLQYSALAGQAPVVQPWMMPLMTQNQPTSGSIQPGGEDAQTFQYSLPQAQVGQPIPGFGSQATQYQGGQYGGSATLNPYWSNPVQWAGQNYNPGTPDYSKLPQLQQPTEAYWQGMGPTQQSQYLQYEQARTGAPDSQTLWGLPWNQALEAKGRALTAQTDADRAEAARKKAFAAWMPSGGMNLSYRR